MRQLTPFPEMGAGVPKMEELFLKWWGGGGVLKVFRTMAYMIFESLIVIIIPKIQGLCFASQTTSWNFLPILCSLYVLNP